MASGTQGGRNQAGRAMISHSRRGEGPRKQVGNYIIGKTIGEGTFGKVKLAIHIPTGEKVAVKILEKSKIKDQADIRRVNREIKILKRARHANVIQLFEVLDTANAIYLIMEICEGGEMFDYIVKHRHVKEPQACAFFHQIVDGLEALHAYEITHRDLKPENLLLKAAPSGWIVKIVDFGLSNTHDGGRLLSTACGSPCYAAPEMIAGKRYEGPRADTWSMGCILFALVCGYLPFEDPNTTQLYKKILAGDYKPAKWLSPDVRDLIRKILEVDPAKRYTINDIRKHKWYQQVAESSVPRETVLEGQHKAEHAEIMQLMTADGKFEHSSIEHELNAGSCNNTTAMYFLLRQKLRKKAMAEQRAAAQQATKHRAGQPLPSMQKRQPAPTSQQHRKQKHEGPLQQQQKGSASVTSQMAQLQLGGSGQAQAQPQSQAQAQAQDQDQAQAQAQAQDQDQIQKQPVAVEEAPQKEAVPAPVAENKNKQFGQSNFQRRRHESFMDKVDRQKRERAERALKNRSNVPRLSLVQQNVNGDQERGLPTIGTKRLVEGNTGTLTSQTAREASNSKPSRPLPNQVQSARGANPDASTPTEVIVPHSQPVSIEPPAGFGGMFTGAPEGFGVPEGDADDRPNTRRSRSRGGARQKASAANSDNTGLEISGTGLAPEPQERDALQAVIPITAMEGSAPIKSALQDLPVTNATGGEKASPSKAKAVLTGSPLRVSAADNKNGPIAIAGAGAEAPSTMTASMAPSAPKKPAASNIGGGGRAGRNIVTANTGPGQAGDVTSPRAMAEQNKSNALKSNGIF